jgi:predicted anti-sigma-YlaC factor YlaD
VSAPHAHGGAECKALFARLSEYLDGEIDAEGCAHVDGHLADCPPCRDFLESLRRTVRLVQSEPGGVLPEEARRAVLESWRRVRRTRSGE